MGRFKSCKEREQKIAEESNIVKLSNPKKPTLTDVCLPLKSVAFHPPVIDRQDGFANQSGKTCPDWSVMSLPQSEI